MKRTLLAAALMAPLLALGQAYDSGSSLADSSHWGSGRLTDSSHWGSGSGRAPARRSHDAYQAPAPAPTHITHCDGGGCYDNYGTRYNANGGGGYNSSANGRYCEDIGGQMLCH